MIQILSDKIVIEIDTKYPIDDLSYLKSALYRVLIIFAESDNFGREDIYYLSNIFNLLHEMEYDTEQIEKAFDGELKPESVHKDEIGFKKEVVSDPKENIEYLKERNQFLFDTIANLEKQVDSFMKQSVEAVKNRE